MAIRFDCPNCKANYEVADDLANKMIMCRVCKKRGHVKSLTAPDTATTVPSIKKSFAVSPSRRSFMMIGAVVVASLGSIATGALLARRPWYTPPTDGPGGPGRRRGPPPDQGGAPADKGGPRPKGPVN